MPDYTPTGVGLGLIKKETSLKLEKQQEITPMT
jgi:hypothetical protein